MMENLVTYRNVRKLFQSYAIIFLVTKIINCSLTLGSQGWISYITLDRKEYMLLVQFDWTIYEVVLLMQTEIFWKIGRGAMNYRGGSNSAIMALKWVDNNLLISHQTLLELSRLGSWKAGVERRRWEKHSMSSNCSTIQQKDDRCWPGGHVAIIASNTVKDKALVPKDILASHWYDQDQCLDPIPSSHLSEWKIT